MFVFSINMHFTRGFLWSRYSHHNFPINTTLLRSEAAPLAYNLIVDRNITVMDLLHQEHRVYSTVLIQASLHRKPLLTTASMKPQRP